MISENSSGADNQQEINDYRKVSTKQKGNKKSMKQKKIPVRRVPTSPEVLNVLDDGIRVSPEEGGLSNQQQLQILQNAFAKLPSNIRPKEIIALLPEEEC